MELRCCTTNAQSFTFIFILLKNKGKFSVLLKFIVIHCELMKSLTNPKSNELNKVDSCLLIFVGFGWLRVDFERKELLPANATLCFKPKESL